MPTAPLASIAVTPKTKRPDSAGVPDSTPTAKLNPRGSKPSTISSLYGASPPSAVIVVFGYSELTVPEGSGGGDSVTSLPQRFTASASSVTAPFCESTRPASVTPWPKALLLRERDFPATALSSPSVTGPPTIQKTRLLSAPSFKVIFVPGATTRSPPIRTIPSSKIG